MTLMDPVRAVANALLYEGYMLYPYRPSAFKNHRPGWSLGSLLPPAYVSVTPGERDSFSAELLMRSPGDAQLVVEARFLQMASAGSNSMIERCVTGGTVIASLLSRPQSLSFDFRESAVVEGKHVAGRLELGAESVAEGLVKLRLGVQNLSVPETALLSRDEALCFALIAAHVIVTISDGEFVSLLDPPDELRSAAAGCTQAGVFPVLAGLPAQRTAMLVSPIILGDYPQIAPESRGDFFDSSEIDEMLTLRVLTLSEREKQEIRMGELQAGEILARTESLMAEDVLKLHGVFRTPPGGKEKP